jgi:Xaa-Pro aminopeptidase
MVLQGHIALDKAVFPEGTPGFVLDVLARSSLWEIGLDYRHGIGLTVHCLIFIFNWSWKLIFHR